MVPSETDTPGAKECRSLLLLIVLRRPTVVVLAPSIRERADLFIRLPRQAVWDFTVGILQEKASLAVREDFREPQPGDSQWATQEAAGNK